LIKMIELWTNVNSWNLCPSMVFGDGDFALVFFALLEINACLPHLQIMY